MIKTADLLNELTNEVNKGIDYATKFWQGASPEQFAWTPEGEQWSVWDICTHLTEFANTYIGGLEQAINIAKGQQSKPTDTYRPSMVGHTIISTVNPQNIDQLHQSGHFAHKEFVTDNPNIATQFLQIQNRLLAVLEQARSIDILETTVPSQFDKNFQFQFGDCLIYIIQHQVLHFIQSDKIIGQYMEQLQKVNG